MWVLSLALLRGLRIQRCCGYGNKLAATASDSTPSLGTSKCHDVALKKQKKKKKGSYIIKE